MNSSHEPESKPELQRGLGLLQATSLNVANMVGIGPFITIPLLSLAAFVFVNICLLIYKPKNTEK